MSTLTIIRGLPGSGKSTLAKKMRGVINIEADDYFIISYFVISNLVFLNM